MLRALQVPNATQGALYEGLLRVAVLGMDLSAAGPGINNPEGFAFCNSPQVLTRISVVEVQAGPLGCWLSGWLTTAFGGAVTEGQIALWDSVTAAEATAGDVLQNRSVCGYEEVRNGGPLSTVWFGDVGILHGQPGFITDNNFQRSILATMGGQRGIWWLGPGQVARFYGQVTGELEMSVLIREPLRAV